MRRVPARLERVVTMCPVNADGRPRCACGAIVDPDEPAFCRRCGRSTDGDNVINIDARRRAAEAGLARDWAHVRSEIQGTGFAARAFLALIEATVKACGAVRRRLGGSDGNR